MSVAGAAGGLWAVEGGNEKVPQRLIEESGARVIRRAVSKLERLSTGRIAVHPAARSDIPPEGDEYVFDAVVIATPQTEDMPHQIAFKGFVNNSLVFRAIFR